MLISNISHEPFLGSQTVYEKTMYGYFEIYENSADVTPYIPPYTSVSSFIFREKRNHYPSSLQNFFETLNEQYFDRQDPVNCLLCKDFETHPMVMLGNISVLKRVSSFNNLRIYMDGTFKSASSQFYMLYIIHAKVYGQNFPLVFSFLNSKSEETYAHMLKKL
ncbi:hypothetical protein DMUE_3726 [Dictyocoela muelleri]|nr:hypothetical protein DMUE_3726 [Dictyocoela muelleri]